MLAGLTALAVLALGVPLASLTRWLVRGSSTGLDVGALGEAAVTTVGLAVAAGLLATLAALPVAWLAVRHRGLVTTLVERSTYPASALPGIVVALALVTVSIRSVPALYQTVALLLLGYAILFLPRGVVSVRATLELVPPVSRTSPGPSAAPVRRRPRGSRCRCSCRAWPLSGAGLARGLHRAHRHAAPVADRHLDARHPVLVRRVLGRLRCRRAVRPALILLSVPATWLLSRLAKGSES